MHQPSVVQFFCFLLHSSVPVLGFTYLIKKALEQSQNTWLCNMCDHPFIESIHFTHAWSLTKGVRSRGSPHSNQYNAWPCSDLAGKLTSSPTPCACCSFEWLEHSIVFPSKWPLIRNMDTLYWNDKPWKIDFHAFNRKWPRVFHSYVFNYP